GGERGPRGRWERGGHRHGEPGLAQPSPRHGLERAARGTRLRPAMLSWRLVGTLLGRSEEHTSELQSRENLVCRLLLEKKIAQIIGSQIPPVLCTYPTIGTVLSLIRLPSTTELQCKIRYRYYSCSCINSKDLQLHFSFD